MNPLPERRFGCFPHPLQSAFERNRPGKSLEPADYPQDGENRQWIAVVGMIVRDEDQTHTLDGRRKLRGRKLPGKMVGVSGTRFDHVVAQTRINQEGYILSL